VPELLRVLEGRLTAADRVDEPIVVPDVEKLRKALEWPTELPPKSSAAAIKRADAAIAAALTAPAELERAIEKALAAGLTTFKNGDAVVAGLDTAARLRLLEAAADSGAADVLTALLAVTPEADRTWLLARAVVKGKIHGVAALLAAGADVNGVAPSVRDDPDKRPALHWAVHHGHRPVVRQLLQAGARVTNSPALARAIVRTPDLVTWQLLLAAGLDVNGRDHHGDPLLLVLGRNGLTGMLDATIAAGADVNATYPDGSTLLLRAVDLANYKVRSPFFIENLLRAGADPNAGRMRGRNPLALALVVPYDPGAERGERWIAAWLTKAGAVAAEDPGAPRIAREQLPPAPPVWSARIDTALARAPPTTTSSASASPPRRSPRTSSTRRRPTSVAASAATPSPSPARSSSTSSARLRTAATSTRRPSSTPSSRPSATSSWPCTSATGRPASSPSPSSRTPTPPSAPASPPPSENF
jgi:ankyrin repeat protein